MSNFSANFFYSVEFHKNLLCKILFFKNWLKNVNIWKKILQNRKNKWFFEELLEKLKNLLYTLALITPKVNWLEKNFFNINFVEWFLETWEYWLFILISNHWSRIICEASLMEISNQLSWMALLIKNRRIILIRDGWRVFPSVRIILFGGYHIESIRKLQSGMHYFMAGN